MKGLTVSQAARKLESELGHPVPPQKISNLFYQRRLDDARCPIVGRNRIIPHDYLPAIKAALQAGDSGAEA